MPGEAAKTFAPASVSEVLRSLQKDSLYAQRLTASVCRIVAPQIRTKFGKEIEALCLLVYRLATTGLGLQTLGEEYVGLIEIDSPKAGKNLRIPSRITRIGFCLLSVAPRYLLSRIDTIREWLCRHQNVADRQCDLEFFLNMLEDSVNFVETVCLALFYLSNSKSVYASLAQRLTLINYLSIVPRGYATSDPSLQKFYKFLGVLTGFQAAVIGSRLLIRTYRKLKAPTVYDLPMRDLATEEEADYKSQYICVLCRGEAENPTCTTPCGHLYCWSCLQHWLVEYRENSCALCKSSPVRVVFLHNL